MNKINHKKRYWGRRNVAVILCVFLLTTSIATMAKDSLPQVEIFLDESTAKMSKDSLSTLSYSFSFTEPTFTETKLLGSTYTKMAMPGAITIGKSLGAPVLPTKSVKLLLPPFKQVKNVYVIGEPVEINTKTQEINEKPILPYQNPIPIGSELPKTIAFDEQIYSSNTYVPSSLFNHGKVGYCRGFTIFSVTLNPVQYIPSEGIVSYYPEMTINIELEEDEYQNSFYRNDEDDKIWVQTLVSNPDMVQVYPDSGMQPLSYPGGICDPIDDYDYVIITTTQNGLDYWPTGGSTPYNWESLMNKHETEDGLNCTLVTIQDIDAHPDYQNPNPLFNDIQAHIREFCKDAYQDWGTEYIFIGGDDEWIPARHMKYDYEGNVDSDIYWSNLDFTFNDDQDGYWGEEGDTGFDLYAELFIGRITCDTPQDVSNWMTKSFYYTDSSFQDYLDNAAFYGGITGWSAQGDDFIDYSAIKGTDDYLGPNPGEHGPYPTWLGFQYGFETWNYNNPGREYDLSVKWTGEPPNPGWQGGSESAAINGLRTAINNDEVTLISGIAHADEYMSLDVMSSTWESQYHNTKPFFIHDYGCHCGDMDAADDGVLHSMLFHSDTELAFAAVYNTCYGWGSYADTNSSSALQQKSFWDFMFDTNNNSLTTQNWQLGRAMAWSKDLMAPTIDWTYDGAPGSWRGIIQGCLLFGDPAQRIKPPVQPEHNVGIQSLDVSSHEPADTDIWVGATLYNNGMNDETNVEVLFKVDGFTIETTSIPLFAQNTFEDVGWWYHTPTSGWETLCVEVTPVPGEDLLYDNQRCKDVIYGPDIAVTVIQAPEYLGQGFAQDVSGYIENLGPTDETITIEFYANDIFEESTVIFLASGQSTWVSFLWDGINSGIGTYDVRIYAVPVPDEYYLLNQEQTQTVTVFSAIGNILLVDDDDGDSYETWYEDALMASSYIYEVWDHSSQGSPTPSTMQDYTAVIWFTGDDYYTTLSSTDQSNLATYLDAGGKLFISGQDIGYDMGGSSFYTNYLHANYQVDTAGHAIVGEAGDIIGNGLSFYIEGGDGANNQVWPDGIQPISPATSCFYYSDSTPNKGGIKVESGAYRLVYLSFGFEAIDNMDDRTMVMTRVLGWLAAEHDVAVSSLDVPAEVTYGEIVMVEATILNSGINEETDIIVDFTVDGFVENTSIIPSLLPGQSTQVIFDWDPPAIGTYEVGVEVHPVPGEEILINNQMYATVDVQGVQNDVGVTEILYPWGEIYCGWHTVEATIYNFGENDQTNVPISCLIFPVGGGGYDYSSSETVNISSQESVQVAFIPPWHAEEGNYTIQVTTRLFGDENPDNNQMIIPVTILPAIPGDVDRDGDVDINDFLLLLAAWGPCDDCDDCPADFDGNCVVNVNDFLILLANWTS